MFRKADKLIPAIPVALVLGSMLFSHSCANTSTPPTGGDKDTIPPVIVGLNPLPGYVDRSRKGIEANDDG